MRDVDYAAGGLKRRRHRHAAFRSPRGSPRRAGLTSALLEFIVTSFCAHTQRPPSHNPIAVGCFRGWRESSSEDRRRILVRALREAVQNRELNAPFYPAEASTVALGQASAAQVSHTEGESSITPKAHGRELQARRAIYLDVARSSSSGWGFLFQSRRLPLHARAAKISSPARRVPQRVVEKAPQELVGQQVYAPRRRDTFCCVSARVSASSSRTARHLHPPHAQTLVRHDYPDEELSAWAKRLSKRPKRAYHFDNDRYAHAIEREDAAADAEGGSAGLPHHYESPTKTNNDEALSDRRGSPPVSYAI